MLTFDAHSPARLARFWDALVPRADNQVGLRFVPSTAAHVRPHRMHVHLTSTSLDDQQRTVDRALALGADHLDVGQLPSEGHVVLADPEGYEFCVIEPGNSFLAGCGFLGELACDGSREVGLFWSAALRWPLVWDQDGETAIQAPGGGTKIAWAGPPVTPQKGRSRQRFEVPLVSGDLRGEVGRLVSLGAGELGMDGDGAAVLTDPDGNEFRLGGGSS